MSRRDPYRKRLQNLLNGEALKTPEGIRSTMETTETYAPGGRTDKLMKLRESLDSEEQTLLILRVDKGMSWEDIPEVMRRPWNHVRSD